MQEEARVDQSEFQEPEIWHMILKRIEALTEADVSIGKGMFSIIELTEPYFPHDDWYRLCYFDYDDTAKMEAWLKGMLEREPLPQDTKGLFFGLFNPYNDAHQPTADLYVTGSSLFRADDLRCEWACDPQYLPQGRHAKSEVLDAIYRIAYDQKEGLQDRAEYPLCLAYGVLIAKHLLTILAPSIILGEAEEIGVAVGYDDGDCVVLGKVGRSGFSPFEREGPK
jgi:hypothetical protein